MPSLGRARIVNTRFSGGKKYYEDLQLNSNGDALVIDMVNGGGKSFLIQCIGQTIIPNSKWQNDWEFKAVFEPKNKNTVVHMMTEWELDEGMEYKYLLAGFCAFKPLSTKDDENNAYGDFERFSYICLYNNRNENDIFNFPLKETGLDGKNKFLSLNELKRYLNSIKSSSYYTEIFHTAKAYRNRLSQYNITEAEWELIKGVNADEKYVATYLRQYPNAEKFIMDFLVPKIEECYSTRHDYEYQDSEKLATSLLNIRAQMDELLKSKAKSKEYTKIIEYIEKLNTKIIEIFNTYEDRENLYIEIKKSIIYLNEELEGLNADKENMETAIEELNSLIHSQDIYIQSLLIRDIEKKIIKKTLDEKETKDKINRTKSSLDREKNNLLFKKMENEYHSVVQERVSLANAEAKIKVKELSNKELVDERNSLGISVKRHLNAKLKNIKEEKAKNLENINCANSELDKYSDSIRDKKSEILSLEKDNEKNISEIRLISSSLNSNKFNDIKNIEKDIYSKRKLEDDLNEGLAEIDDLNEKRAFLSSDIQEAHTTVNELDKDNYKLGLQYNEENNKLKEAEKLYNECENLFELYNCNSVEKLYDLISTKKDVEIAELSKIKQDIIKCETIINTIKTNKITLNDDTLLVFDIIKNKFPNATLGLDFISSLDMKEKEYFISMNDLIPYSVLLEENDFKKFIVSSDIFDNYYGGAVPIISKKTLEQAILYPNGVLFSTKKVDFYTDEEKKVKLRVEKEKELSKLNELKVLKESSLTTLTENLKPVSLFIDKFENKTNMESIASKVNNLESLLNESENNIVDCKKLINSLKADLHKVEEKISFFKESNNKISNEIALLNNYLEMKNILNKLNANNEENNSRILVIKDELKVETDYIKEIRNRMNEMNGIKDSLTEQEIKLSKDIENVSYINDNGCCLLEEHIYIAKNSGLLAINRKLQGVDGDLATLQASIRTSEDRIVNSINNIKREGFKEDEFQHINVDFVKHKEELFSKLNEYIKNLEDEYKNLNNEYIRISNEKSKLEGDFDSKISALLENYFIDYNDIKSSVDNKLNGLSYIDKVSEIKKESKEAKSKKSEIQSRLKDINKSIESVANSKNNFISLNKDIDVEIGNDKLQSIRSYTVVSREVKSLENSILYKLSDYKKEISIGKNIVTHVYGFREILEDIETLPTKSSEIKDISLKLVGSSDESWVNMLSLEQNKIEENIKSLEVQEEKFITLCIQKSENVLRDIKKINDLSVIEIHGRRQQMLRINLEKLPEDILREKMKNYIEGLMTSCANEENDETRKLRISKGLTTDNLLRQIIDVIKNKSVELYKLEDIENQEVNEWLSLNKAYGSKGETNGMYITMLICIISYLRKLYTSSTDDSKKVLILDNPFSGTTSEIIWYPILNLLKENNVQLWAVGYEIKTQLADIFPTRYYMTKESGHAYEKIVIDKFKSEYDLGSLRYNELTGSNMGVRQINLNLDEI
ncbi:hypothetical protein [Clostridium sp.]|uniref:hypothetical protein n=1 Tax=Clostridium sp. TaxID=1506 RepID=UPI00290611F1|nr:hypothetical protein [Clostridium sp.]MDU5107841.1 hypothetical protein [Clostridium sp.]